MNMKFTDFDIEHYVRFPNDWSTEKKNHIQKYIEQNEYASNLEAYYRQLYQEIDNLQKNNMVILEFSKGISTSSEFTVLAADSAATSSSQLSTIATFKTSDQSKLLRVLFNGSTNTFELHLISSDDDNLDPTIVHFKGIHSEFILDKNGVLKNIRKSDLDTLNWIDTQVNMMFPSNQFSYSPNSENTKSFKFNDSSLEIFEDHVIISASLSSYNRVLITQNDRVELHYIESAPVHLNIDSTFPFQLYFYNSLASAV